MSEQNITTTASIIARTEPGANEWLTELFAYGPNGIVVAGTDIRVHGAMAERIDNLLTYARATGEEVVRPRDWCAYQKWAEEAIAKRDLGREVLKMQDERSEFLLTMRSDLKKFADLNEVPVKGLNKFLVDHGMEPFPVKIRGKVLLYAEPLEVEIEDLDFDGDPSDEEAVNEALMEAAHTLYSNDETDPFNYDDGQSEVEEWEIDG
jgi:hypothetical protein